MGSAASRRERKVQKERDRVKRQAKLDQRREVAFSDALQCLSDQVRGRVASGEAKIAVGMLPTSDVLLISMWDESSVQVVTQRIVVRHAGSLNEVNKAVVARGVALGEWASFLAEFQSACAAAEHGQAAISLLGWRPGEVPPSASTGGSGSGLPSRL
jgi:hypothetical protein